MKRLNTAIALFVSILTLPSDLFAWNIPGHMLSGVIAYQTLRQESPATIETVRSVLEENPWYQTTGNHN